MKHLRTTSSLKRAVRPYNPAQSRFLTKPQLLTRISPPPCGEGHPRSLETHNVSAPGQGTRINLGGRASVSSIMAQEDTPAYTGAPLL